MTHTREILCYFPFIGLGVGALGFQRGAARVGNLQAKFVCIGGFDNDAGAVANAQRLLNVPISLLDGLSRGQYIAFHGKHPPEGWRELTPADIRRSAGYRRPNIVFTSPPCKGFSGLTSESKSRTPKYQALNELALRGIWLTLEAWADDPPEFFIMENVPRILTRGAHLVELFSALLRSYGYAIATPPNLIHNCGELGGLAQNRNRALIVARHMEKVPNFLYQPVRQQLKAVGDVLSKLPLPDHPSAGPLHGLPRLSWKTWLRLAFVEAGKDWRSLNRLAVEDGMLRDFALVPEVPYRNGVLGVHRFDDTATTIAGESLPNNGAFSVADPRWESSYDCGQYGVLDLSETAPTVRGGISPGQGRGFAVADCRLDWQPGAHQNKFRVVRMDGPAGAVIGSNRGPGGGAQAVADVRTRWERHNNALQIETWGGQAHAITGAGKGVQGGWASIADVRLPDTNPNRQNGLYRTEPWEGQAHAVTGAVHLAGGALGVADVRVGLKRGRGDHYLTAGHYGMVPWGKPAYAITGSLQHDNGHGNVADIRLPGPDDRLRCLIVAEDGTWHRPFTTMENAALQSIFDPEEYMHFQLLGSSDQKLREWIGNAVPRDAAAAMAGVFGQALLLAWSGQTQIVTGAPVWVQPVIAAIQCGDGNA